VSDVQQYAAEQQAASKAMVAAAAALAAYYGIQLLTPTGWLKLLEQLFPLFVQQRTMAAESSRRFYDAQRSRHFPIALRHDILLPATTWDGFVKSMEPAYRQVQAHIHRANAAGVPVQPEKIAQTVALAVDKGVRDSGRDTAVVAAETDVIVDETGAEELKAALQDLDEKPKKKTNYAKVAKKVIRWARMATGEETCGWCWMLVSRGPQYSDAASAGLDSRKIATDIDALELLDYTDPKREVDADTLKSIAQAAKGHMKEWHPGCDCIAVPVFDRNDWPGKDDQAAAEGDWKEAVKKATEIVDAKLGDKMRINYRAAQRRNGKVVYSEAGGIVYSKNGVNLGRGRAINREAINAMRILQEKGPEGLERWLERKLAHSR